MQNKLSQMLNHPASGSAPFLASSTAGLGSVFVAIGDKRLKQGGRMALVLPEALGFGVAWQKTRQLLSNRYVVEMLIVSHDPDRWNFSENTELSEILVVAKKRVQGDSVNDAKTICVNLWKNTDSIVDAMALADAIQRIQPAEVDGGGALHGVASLRVGNDKRGEVVLLDWTDLQNQQWYPCSFAQTDLVRVAHFLRRKHAYLPGIGIVGQVPLVPLGTLGTLGPDRRDIKDGFDDVSYVTNYPAFWSHDAQRMKTLDTATNRYLEPLSAPRPGRKLKPVSHLIPKAGRLMLAEGLRANTQSVVAVRLNQPALSNVWWSMHLNMQDESAEKALAIWLNSTLGLIAVLSHRVPTHGPWMHFKKDIYETALALDVTNLTPEQLKILADVYDAVATSALLPLPQMGQDATRATIDAAISQALSLPALDTLRQTLAREPIVTGVSLLPPANP
jgi:hypothetical protein